MRIQIVDDSPNMREVVKFVLADIGADFIEAGDGFAALEQYAELRPDVVIMDIRMPRMDGIATTRAMCAIARAARVIILSQYDDDDLRTAARAAGASGYILKDDISRLVQLVSMDTPNP